MESGVTKHTSEGTRDSGLQFIMPAVQGESVPNKAPAGAVNCTPLSCMSSEMCFSTLDSTTLMIAHTEFGVYGKGK